jgi:hypothetical protein
MRGASNRISPRREARKSTEENKALAFRHFDQRWNHNNEAVINELLAKA